MKTIIPVVAGPFPDRISCFRYGLSNGYFVSSNDVRRGYHGYYIYDRNVSTHHVASKKIRREIKELVKQLTPNYDFDLDEEGT